MRLKLSGVVLAITGLARSQGVAPLPPAFEVATIKPSRPDVGFRNFRFVDAHRWTANNQTLKECIAHAYGLPDELISGGPAWVASDKYDIVAIEPGETRPSNEQNMLMFQNLLADRFRLRFHRERKQMAVYNLVVGKAGPKMTESTLGPEKYNLIIGPSPRGGPLLPARAATMERFAAALQESLLDRPVLDRTGLTKRYDFDLEFSPEGTLLAPPGGGPYLDSPDIFTAIQQIGLKLEPANGEVEILVIDRAEKPNDN